MGEAGQDQAVHVGENRVERLALLGRHRRKAGADFAGLDAGEDREGGDALLVIGDPIHHGVAPAAEVLR